MKAEPGRGPFAFSLALDEIDTNDQLCLLYTFFPSNSIEKSILAQNKARMLSG
jgi:hypothetical protein